MWKPTTGEPYAGEPHVRFGGRGGATPLPDPYREERASGDGSELDYSLLRRCDERSEKSLCLCGELLLPPRQDRFSEPHPIARTQWQYRVIEIVVRAVQHPPVLRAAVADPDIGTWLFFEETGEVLRGHTRQRVAFDIVVTDQGSGRIGGDLRFGCGIDRWRVTALVSQAHCGPASTAG